MHAVLFEVETMMLDWLLTMALAWEGRRCHHLPSQQQLSLEVKSKNVPSMLDNKDQAWLPRDSLPSVSAPRPPLLKTRRSSMQSVVSALLLLPVSTVTFPSTAFGTEQDEDVSVLQCPDEACVLTESAVPGAYQQECMQLPVRSIPIQQVSSDSRQKREVVLHLQQGVAGAGSTGMAVWNSSLLLSRLLQALARLQPRWLARKAVLELGCGPGLVSLTAAALGASHVVATDGNPDVVRLASTNLEENQARLVDSSSNNRSPNTRLIEAQQLPWGMLSAMDWYESADLVLGSDLTYNAGTWRALAGKCISNPL